MQSEVGYIPRVLPIVDDVNRFFWESGAIGKLRFLQCHSCRLFLHPPVPICRRCRGTNIDVAAVSGLGEVVTFTVNVHPWNNEVAEPYVIAIVNLEEQDDLNLTTNIVGCPVEDVHVGMAVEVEFFPLEELWLPLFRPRGEDNAEGP